MKRQPKLLKWILLLSLGTVLLILVSWIANVGHDPNPNSYSEFSRIYDASLIWSKKLNGQGYPWPVLDPARAIMEALTFVYPGPSLIIFRAWNVILWVGMTILFSISLARRFRDLDRQTFWLVVLLGFLFVFQGPIYYHLLIAPIIVLAFYDHSNFRCSTRAVMFASVWVGLCRINLFPLPGALAAYLYLIELPAKHRSLRHYLAKPVLFIDHRHLIAFGYVDVPLYMRYEKVYLMEMLMAHKCSDVEEFEQQLSEHEFSVIIPGSQNTLPSLSILAPEENDWLKYVSRWIHKYYERVYRPDKLLMWIPKTE